MIAKHIQEYCCEDISKIENYAEAVADQEQVWDCHHRRETIYSKEGLIEIGEYWNRPAAELIFLKHEQHISIHKAGSRNHMYGKHHDQATKDKISAANKGRKLSAAHKAKISEATRAAMSNPEVIAKLSEAKKGKPSPRKGAHLSEETKAKLSAANLGRKWTEEQKKRQSEAIKHYWERKRQKQQ